MERLQESSWHTESIESTVRKLASDPERGLSAGEAERRLAEYGPNTLREQSPRSLGSMFIAQLKEVLVLILLAAALISGFLGDWAEVAVILVIVLLNAALGVYQEHRAEQALQALKRMTRPTARVIREGEVTRVSVEQLVPGDLVLLEAGDAVPADLRLTGVASLSIDESALTGESLPVEKEAVTLTAEEVPLGDRRNLAFMGTSVTAGRGSGLVTATGMQTQLGRIATMLQATPPEVTPLQRRLGELGRVLGAAALVIVLVVFITGLWRGEQFLSMFLIAISLAVAAVPEGLPAVVTIVLSLGVTRMSQRRAVVRRLPAVETLGTVTTICTDKTGTLTRNELTVTRLYLPGRLLQVTGRGYRPQGEFIDEEGNPVHLGQDEGLQLLLLGGVLCNDAWLQQTEGGYRVLGDPTEGALVVAAAKAGLDKVEVERKYPRLSEIPFDSGRKLMTTWHNLRGEIVSFTKGAPDVLLDRCTGVLQRGATLSLNREERERLAEINARLASQGERVLALALRRWPAIAPEPDPESAEQDLTLVGFLAMQDAARPEAGEAVAVARRAGIRTVMITGDHPATAVAIARELDIWREGEGVLKGTTLAGLEEGQLREAVRNTTVYARVSPEDKLRIVQALKANNQVVAMTGDGVNDAPALKQADIGVAMGITGTEVAKEAADLVLLDDNFATIVRAVQEGRTIYGNIRKAVQYLLSCNIGEIVAIFTAILLGLGSPLTPIQILWLNLVTDGLPALALGQEPPEAGVMRRPPRPLGEGVLAGGMGLRILWQGALIGLLSLGVYWLTLSRGGSPARAHTMAFAALALMQLVHSFNVRSPRVSLFTLGPLGNRTLVYACLASAALQVMVLVLPFLRGVFGVVPLTAGEWGTVLVFSLVPLVVVEAGKLLARVVKRGVPGAAG